MQQQTKRQREKTSPELFRRFKTRKSRGRREIEPAQDEAPEKRRPVGESEREHENSDTAVERAEGRALQYAKFLGGLAAVGLLVSLGATLGIVGLSLLILAFGWVTSGIL